MTETLIIIPAYNSERFLSQCLESVRSQTDPNWQLVVVDDGSSDNTASIAEAIADTDSRITVHRQKNRGVAAARNLGLSYLAPSTQYIMWLDNDDYLLPDALECLKQQLEVHQAAPAAYGMPITVGLNGEVINNDITQSFGYTRYRVNEASSSTYDSNFTDFSCFVVWDCIATPGQALVRRQSVDVVGGFDPATVPSDDWDMWLRLSLLGPFAYLNRFVLNKRAHDENISSIGSVMGVAEPAIRYKLATSNLLILEQRRIARSGHLRSCSYKLSWAKDEIKQGKLIAASKTAARALRSYIRYLRTPYKMK